MKKNLNLWHHHAAILLFISVLILTGTFPLACYAQPQLSYTPVVQGLTLPLEIKNAADGSGRLFLVEQRGVVKIYKNGQLQPTPFLDISAKVAPNGEYRGFWSIAFPPNYAKYKVFFVLYVDRNNNTILSRFQVSKNNPDVAVPTSEQVIMTFPQNNFGPFLGEMHFGRDGYLYCTINDGSFLEKTSPYSQNGQALFGKLLRINVLVKNAPYYSIPPDNPFVNDPNVRDEIYAMGFRNAWRWSFDRKKGDMWFADDGGDQWEEVDLKKAAAPAGDNYGWPCYEGDAPFMYANCDTTKTFTMPAFTYGHDSTTGGFAIIGGYVYNGNNYPTLKGYYICSDYITNNAWMLKANTAGQITQVLTQSNVPAGIAGYGEDEAGELYAASLDGTIYQVGAVADALQATTISNASIADNTNLAQTKIYPTIVNAQSFTIETKLRFTSMHIYDASGNEVYTQSMKNMTDKTNIQLPSLLKGMYIIYLAGGEKSYRQKIYISN